MFGLDTDVLVRFLVRDDEEQFLKAQNLIRPEAHAGTPVLMSHLVLLETEWVLRSRYKLSKAEILAVLSDLMSAVNVTFEDEPAIEEALFIWKNSSAQFAGLPDQRTLWNARVQGHRDFRRQCPETAGLRRGVTWSADLGGSTP